MATEGERDRWVPEMGRIRDKRKMKEKKGAEKRRRMTPSGSTKCMRQAYAERRRKIQRVWGYYERGGLSRSLESIDKFGIPKGRPDDYRGVTVIVISVRLRDQRRSEAAIHHRQIAELRYKMKYMVIGLMLWIDVLWQKYKISTAFLSNYVVPFPNLE